MDFWALKYNHPYTLVLAADARLGPVDDMDDQIWEVRLGQGDATALVLHTTYGTRAKDQRLFFSFVENSREVRYARDYHGLPRVQYVSPAYLEIVSEPFEKLIAWQSFLALDSHTLIGRIRLSNPSTQQRIITLQIAGLLTPLDGTPFRVVKQAGVNILAGKSGGLEPVVFVTGGAEPANSPYAALELKLELGPGASRTLTWVHVGEKRLDTSFDLARRAAAQPLDPVIARIQRLQESDIVFFETGDREWDALLTFSQVAALGKLLRSNRLPHIFPVGSRQPDQGYATLPDGRDHPADWQGPTPFDLWYLPQTLPGAPHIWRAALQNFLKFQASDGSIPARLMPKSRPLPLLAAPLLADVAWRYWQHTHDDHFIAAVLPQLRRFFWAWFAPANDRDQNGLPEWQHPLQTGYPENPLFSCDGEGQGVAIETVQTPMLAALLLHEGKTLLALGEAIGDQEESEQIAAQIEKLRQAMAACWQEDAGLYAYCDRDTHRSHPGEIVSSRQARKTFHLKTRFQQPVRLQIFIEKARADGLRPQVTIKGERDGQPTEETLPPESFCWQDTNLLATTQATWEAIYTVQIANFGPGDRIALRTVDLTARDLTLFLPLWDDTLPDLQAQTLYATHLARAFQRPYGFAMHPEDDHIRPLWNAFILEGLLKHTMQSVAADTLIALGQSAIRCLTTRKAFYTAVHAEHGDGMGERHSLHGIFPVSLFLKVLGVTFLNGRSVRVEGENPFPWTIRVRYRGITVERDADETRVIWHDDPPVCLPANGTHHITF